MGLNEDERILLGTAFEQLFVHAENDARISSKTKPKEVLEEYKTVELTMKILVEKLVTQSVEKLMEEDHLTIDAVKEKKLAIESFLLSLLDEAISDRVGQVEG